MITPLPHWVLTNKFPSVYDAESVTAIRMVAKLYGKMEEMIADYNVFVDRINASIQDFQDGIIADFEEFKNCVTQTMADYIETIDTKIVMQDQKIEEAVQYMKDHLDASVNELLHQMLAAGEIGVELAEQYDAENESLTITLVAIEEEETEQ